MKKITRETPVMAVPRVKTKTTRPIKNERQSNWHHN